MEQYLEKESSGSEPELHKLMLLATSEVFRVFHQDGRFTGYRAAGIELSAKL